MKTNAFYRIVLVLFISIFLASCESKNQTKHISIAMISDLSSIDDKSFNQAIWEGILKYAEDKKLPEKNYYYASSASSDYSVQNLSNFADKKPDLIVASGFTFLEPIDIVAEKYPNQNFLLLDSVSKRGTNVLSVTFAMNEASFLAGIVAAKKAKELNSNKIGFLGGVDIEVVQIFEAGFLAGVEQIDPNLQVVIEYADDFSNPLKGQKIASKMYDSGIKIIFHVAGSTGIGLLKEAIKRAKMGENVWMIGVDRDQYEDGIFENSKSVVLTSVLKKLGIATYDTLVKVEKGIFKGGHKIYTLKDKGVGLPQNNPNLKKEWVDLVKKYEEDIKTNKIIVPSKPKRLNS